MVKCSPCRRRVLAQPRPTSILGQVQFRASRRRWRGCPARADVRSGPRANDPPPFLVRQVGRAVSRKGDARRALRPLGRMRNVLSASMSMGPVGSIRKATLRGNSVLQGRLAACALTMAQPPGKETTGQGREGVPMNVEFPPPYSVDLKHVDTVPSVSWPLRPVFPKKSRRAPQ